MVSIEKISQLTEILSTQAYKSGAESSPGSQARLMPRGSSVCYGRTGEERWHAGRHQFSDPVTAT